MSAMLVDLIKFTVNLPTLLTFCLQKQYKVVF